MSPPPVLFVRHGETDWNRDRRLQGQHDVPMNALGRSQAARNGRAIAHLLSDGDWERVSSPLSRARQTMEIALAEAGRAGSPYAVDERLAEISFGAWEGFTLDELTQAGVEGVGAREADKWNFVPPGGESYAMLADRLGSWLDSLARPTFVVSHGGVMRVLMHLVAGVPAEEAPQLVPPQDKVLRFDGGGVDFI